jgi:hypothetical protein
MFGFQENIILFTCYVVATNKKEKKRNKNFKNRPTVVVYRYI